jgi:hypothetical protein
MTLAHMRSLGLAVALLAVGGPARAERRAFTFTYGYATPPEAEVELALWNTQTRDGLGDDGGFSAAALELGVAYGIADRTGLAVYQALGQSTGSDLRFTGTRLELRHRFADPGEWPVDLAVFASGEKTWGAAAGVVEPRIVIGRDVGPVAIAINLIGEVPIAEEPDADGDDAIDADLVPGWAAGLRYELAPQWQIGGESWGTIADAFGDGDAQTSAWAGPSISWAPSTRLWAAVTGGFGLTDRSDDLVVRFILAVAP